MVVGRSHSLCQARNQLDFRFVLQQEQWFFRKYKSMCLQKQSEQTEKTARQVGKQAEDSTSKSDDVPVLDEPAPRKSEE